jgi:hypothetical protein
MVYYLSKENCLGACYMLENSVKFSKNFCTKAESNNMAAGRIILVWQRQL